LRDGLNAEEALDILWFYLGYRGLFTLVDDNGWTYARAGSGSLLRSSRPCSNAP